VSSIRVGQRACVPCWAFWFKALRLTPQLLPLHDALAERCALFGVDQLRIGFGFCPVCHSKEGFAVTAANVPELLLALAQACRPA
jgi:hypothetical protein